MQGRAFYEIYPSRHRFCGDVFAAAATTPECDSIILAGKQFTKAGLDKHFRNQPKAAASGDLHLRRKSAHADLRVTSPDTPRRGIQICESAHCWNANSWLGDGAKREASVECACSDESPDPNGEALPRGKTFTVA